MKTSLCLLSISLASAIAADAPIPTPQAVAKNYAKMLTLLNEKPKSISAELAGMCRSIPDDEKYGTHSRHYVQHYRNDLAKTPEGKFPPGSVLFKAKSMVMRDGEAAVSTGGTGMIKQPAGTSPKTGDWLFFAVQGGDVVVQKIESCVGCHSGAKRDFVFTDVPKR